MKKILFPIFLTLFIFLNAYLPLSFAQESPDISLPVGAKARLGKGWVNELQYSPDGMRLAVASSVGIWLYDTETYQEIALLTGNILGVDSVAFSPDSGTLASGGTNGTIHIWNAVTGAQQQTLTGHTDTVYSVAFAPDGLTLASGSSDGTVRLWNITSGETQQTFTGHTDAVFSVAFNASGGTLASGGVNGTIRLWNVASGEEEHILIGHTGTCLYRGFQYK